MEYLLVILRSRKTAVVPASALRTAGKFQRVKWDNGHLYLVRVLAKSTNSQYLQSLRVDENGIVIFPEETSPEEGGVHNTYIAGDDIQSPEFSNEAPQLFRDHSEEPSCSRALSTVEFHLSTTKNEKTQTSFTDNPEQRSVASQANFQPLESLQTRSTSINSVGSQCEVDMKDNGTNTELQDETSDDFQDQSTLHNATTSGATLNELNEHNDDLCESAQGDADDANEVDTANFDEVQTISNALWARDGPNRAELVPGSGVFVNSDILFEIIEQYHQDPKELIRRLMKSVIPLNMLLKMTVTGRGKNRSPIPREVLRAVKKCMEENVERQLWLSDQTFRLVLMRMLDKLRELVYRR